MDWRRSFAAGALFVVRGGSEADVGRARSVWFVLVVSATAIVGAALSFTGIQLFSLRAVCPYCIADHLCGVVLAALIFWQAPIRSGASGPALLQGPAKAAAIVVGVAGTATIALTKYNTAAFVQRVDLPTDRDFDIGSGAERRIGVLDGKLHLVPSDEGNAGLGGAPAVFVILYDYSCPHCRHTHGLLGEFKQTHRDRMAVLGLPMPLNRKCNPHAPEEMPERFDNSCELARLALSVKLIDPSQFATFDVWLFEPEMPRQPAEARDEAARLVGKQALEKALGDQRVEENLERNIAAYKASGADRVPVVFAAGVEPTVGRIEDEAILTEILEQTTKGRFTTAATPAAHQDAHQNEDGSDMDPIDSIDPVDPMDSEKQLDNLPAEDTELLRLASEGYRRLENEIGKVIVGQLPAVRALLTAIFAEGHVLIVGVPGLAKTLLVKTLGEVLDWKCHRIQFTPDMMPADIVGMELLQTEQETGQRKMQFVPGPVFANIILADEINRTPPKTQDALLEAMQEYNVTSMGRTHPLDRPFVVVATQNPIEQEGTYPLPEAQLDRFMFSLWMTYPSVEDEERIVLETTAERSLSLEPIFTREQMMAFQGLVRRVPVSKHVVSYAVAIARATRPGEPAAGQEAKRYIEWGAGPRAGQQMVLAGKALAALEGSPTVTARHIRETAPLVLRPRLVLNYQAAGDGVTAPSLIAKILKEIAPPRY